MIRLIVKKPADSAFKKWESSAQKATGDAIKRWKRACLSEESIKKFSRAARVNESVYRHEIVISSLWEQYKKKCAFCERRLSKRDADIEHFRPKGKVKVKRGGKESVVTVDVSVDGRPVRIEHPGYFWLAYSWENFLLTCSGCNQRLKRCLFPLRNEAKRAAAPGLEANEDELLIHPGQTTETLSGHFTVDENGVLVGLTDRADACIDILDLNDEVFIEGRRDQYQRLWKDTRDAFCADRVPGHDPPSDLADIRKRIEDARTGELEYAAAGRQAMKVWKEKFDEMDSA